MKLSTYIALIGASVKASHEEDGSMPFKNDMTCKIESDDDWVDGLTHDIETKYSPTWKECSDMCLKMA